MGFNYKKYNEDTDYKEVIDSMINSKLSGYFGHNGKADWRIIKKNSKFYIETLEKDAKSYEINALLRNV